MLRAAATVRRIGRPRDDTGQGPLVFRLVWSALLLIITGMASAAVSSLAAILLSHVVTLPSIPPELGALIGFGVGIDYALFLVNRHRKALRQGADPHSAIATAMNTSG